MIAIEFPISEKTVKEKMGLGYLHATGTGQHGGWHRPPGRICPLFQGEYLRENEPRWRKVQRFVADKVNDY